MRCNGLLNYNVVYHPIVPIVELSLMFSNGFCLSLEKLAHGT